jgi:hypothetical protein
MLKEESRTRIGGSLREAINRALLSEAPYGLTEARS